MDAVARGAKITFCCNRLQCNIHIQLFITAVKAHLFAICLQCPFPQILIDHSSHLITFSNSSPAKHLLHVLNYVLSYRHLPSSSLTRFAVSNIFLP